MPRTFDVYITTTASATVTTTLTDEELVKIAEDLGTETDKLTYDDLREHVAEKALMDPGAPDICAQCSGWGQSHSLELAGDWDVPDDEGEYKNVVELSEEKIKERTRRW